MKGAIFFSGTYGSTAQYAEWISESTDLPVLDIKDTNADPSKYDFLILGSSVMYYKLTMQKWIKSNLTKLIDKPVILYTVSGAPPGPKLDKWVANSLPKQFRLHIKHIGLRGRMDHNKLSWRLRLLLQIAALFNPDPQASKEERHGFDYMDKDSIEPILKIVRQLQPSEVL